VTRANRPGGLTPQTAPYGDQVASIWSSRAEQSELVLAYESKGGHQS
jgi:hypothetical protein